MMPVFGGEAEVRTRANGSVGFGGLNNCRVANCLTCAPLRSREHADKIRRIVLEAESRGLQCWFLTSNLNSGSNSREMEKFYSDLLMVWNKTFSPRFREKSQILGSVRAFDWTLNRSRFSLNGHYHSIIITAPVEEETFKKDLFARWNRYSLKQTGKRAEAAAQDLQRITSAGIGDYLVKAFDGGTESFNTLEVSAGDKRGDALWGWTLHGLVEEISKTNDKRLIAAYRGIERTLKGKQRISYQGYAKVLFEEAAELEEKPEKNPVVATTKVPRPVWWCFRPHRLKILIAFHLDGMAKEYFTLLCESIAFDPGQVKTMAMEEHLRVFLAALERDRKQAAEAQRIHEELFGDLVPFQ